MFLISAVLGSIYGGIASPSQATTVCGLSALLASGSQFSLTLPITIPLVLAAGFDKIWFGVFVVIIIEMAQITPPVGFNLSVIPDVTGESISRIALAAFTFFLMLVALAMLFTLSRKSRPVCHRSSR